MARNNSVEVFEGGWRELESAVITDNKAPLSSSLPQSFFIKPDGTEIFVMGVTNDTVETFPLSIPYDITTIGAIGNTFLITDDSQPIGIFFRDNGSLMIIVGSNTTTLYAYTLPIPWDVSSIVDSPVSLDLSATTSPPRQCVFSRDGDFVFITDADSVYSYALPTPWDITSANPVGPPTFTPGGGTLSESVAFKREGDRMYIGDTLANIIEEYTLSPVNDITSASLVSTLSLGTQNPADIIFRSNGQEFFISDTVTNDITKFHTDEDWEIVDASHFTNNFALPTSNIAWRDIAWKPDGSQFIVLGNGGQDRVESYATVKPWNISGATFINLFVLTAIEGTPVSMSWTKDGTICYVVGQSELVKQLDVGTAWNVSTITDSGLSFSIASQINPVGGIYVTDDGTTLFASGGSAFPDVAEYTMSTPFDISTASFIQNGNFGFSDGALGIFLKPDGKIVYLVADTIPATIKMFDLTTPFDISTRVLTGSLDVSAQDTAPHGLFIREDNGKKLYFTGINSDDLFSLDMSLEFNNALITQFGDDLETDLGETLVYA